MLFFFLMIRRPPRSTLFPTRRSSDLKDRFFIKDFECDKIISKIDIEKTGPDVVLPEKVGDVWKNSEGVNNKFEKLAEDRKSTRLNSSHANISYAVFCLKKKNNK